MCIFIRIVSRNKVQIPQKLVKHTDLNIVLEELHEHNLLSLYRQRITKYKHEV
jgi:hypothetical protein